LAQGRRQSLLIYFYGEKVMEFKVRLTATKKAHRVTVRKDAGYKRVKIRGRKRWIKAVKAAA
jgi:hypothetical protein